MRGFVGALLATFTILYASSALAQAASSTYVLSPEQKITLEQAFNAANFYYLSLGAALPGTAQGYAFALAQGKIIELRAELQRQDQAAAEATKKAAEDKPTVPQAAPPP